MSSTSSPGLRFEVTPHNGDMPDGSDSLAARLTRAFPTPSDVTLTVTSLPQHGVERTLAASVELAALGFSVVPHVAARGVAGRGVLSELLLRMRGAGITEVFAVSGDASHRSERVDYATSLDLIRDVVELDPGLAIGVACYPEGHPHFSDEHLLQHLQERAPYVQKVVTQLCFSPATTARFAVRLREAGIEAAFWTGVPSAVETVRLRTLSDRLGVGASKSELGGLDGEFDAAGFVAELREQPEFAAGHASLDGIHVYSFNEIERLPGLARAVTVNHA